KDIPENTVFQFKTFIGTMMPKEILTIPIVYKEKVMAVISLAQINGYLKKHLDIINITKFSINSAFSNFYTSDMLIKLTHSLETQKNELQVQSEELQQQNLELDLQKRQIEEANLLKREFLSNMSHELRTPLNSIIALSRLLKTKSQRLPQEEDRYIDIIERNGKDLLYLINDILDMSKIEAGKMDIYLKEFSLKAMLETLIENAEFFFEEKNISIIKDIPYDFPNIKSDESRVHQVLKNLVSNALKFTHEGSITVSAKTDRFNVYITVKDTGIGIDSSDLPHIFDEFRQVDNSSVKKYEGTGLGLAIVQKLLRLLGGSISVESELGKGSAFTVILPIQSDNFEDFTSNTKLNLDKLILLVEDNEAVIIQIKAILKNEGYKLEIAHNGREALDFVKNRIPDGIILDLMMPEIDGFQVLEEIRSTKATKNIPVLVLTAKDLTSEDLKCLSSNNVHQLIQKGDVDIKTLINKIKLMMT
ncbi:MAG: response regulator, partial [Desulfobacterales bacterium]|nr:response regulator [Desulfobacterales bacterium]